MGKRPRVTDVVQGAIADSVDRLVVHETGVLRDDDVTAVHQARVATRRLRSDLHTFASLLEPEPVQELRAELRWLGAELGAVRDLDVLRARLHEHAERLPAPEAHTAERVARRLDADRQAAGRELVSAMQSTRYEQLREALLPAAGHPPFRPDAAQATAADVEAAVKRPWKKLRAAVSALGDEPSDDALHQIRIRAKRVRYAAEASEPLFGKPMRHFAKAVTAVQEILGEHHDAVVAGTWIAKAAEECSTSEAYAAGMLAQVEREYAFAARGRQSAPRTGHCGRDTVTKLVRAAGGVVTRRGAGETLEVLVVHRPKYDDWSLPKGKCEPGESDEEAAIREVAEETGVVVVLGAELESMEYIDRHGRPKVVRYWEMTATGEVPWAPNDEVDEIAWISTPRAATLLSYDGDRRLVAAMTKQSGGGSA